MARRERRWPLVGAVVQGVACAPSGTGRSHRHRRARDVARADRVEAARAPRHRRGTAAM